MTKAYKAQKTAHTGAKHGRGAYWGPERDGKLERNTLRRRQGKHMVRHEEQVPEQSNTDNLRAAFGVRAGGWKKLLNAEELIKHSYAHRLVVTRPVPTLEPLDAEGPPALRVL